MVNKTIRIALVLALAAALNAAALPSIASAKRTRPSGSSATSSGQRASRGSAGVTRSRGSGNATGRATYGYHGRGGWHAYGQGFHSYPYYWYLGYSGLYSWRWGWPYLFDGWCSYPEACHPALYRVVPARYEPGVLETDVKPKRAEVVVDGELVGEARDYNGRWDLLFLKPGDRSVQFRAEGYMTLTLWIEVEPGSYYRIEERLVEGEGSDPRSMERPVAPEKPAPVEEPDAALPQGLLRIEASPPDAAIYLDGEYLARADELGRLHGALPVALGRHVIEVVRPGHAARSVEIVVERDLPRKVRIDLKRKAGAAGD